MNLKLILSIILITALSLAVVAVSYAQIPGKSGFRFISEDPTEPIDFLVSNAVIDMVPDGPDVLMGTGNGLSIWHTADSSWSSYTEDYGLGEGSISALDVKDGVIWAATAYSESTSEGWLPAGGGVGYSDDGGMTWTWYPQPVDPQDPDTSIIAAPTTTNIQNVTYDLLITSTEVWITSWGGGLRKFSFSDSLWHVVTPDNQKFDALGNRNHRAFSVAGDDSILWVGTAEGVNKSTDGGENWVNYKASNGLSGEFVTALGRQQWGDNDVIWASTWQTDTGEYYGVTRSVNEGETWEVVLSLDDQTLKAHNFAFDDSIVYVATNLGLYKSVDGGAYWELMPPMQSNQTGAYFADPEVYCALAHLGILWVGTGNGIAASSDNGNTWDIIRTYNDPEPTYACPNPFRPRSDYFISFVYEMPSAGNVTIKIYDFAMDEVATVIDNAPRGPGDPPDTWNGKRSDGKDVATGVYYYRVDRSGASSVWGKFALMY